MASQKKEQNKKQKTTKTTADLLFFLFILPRYIDLFLEHVATSENISFLYQVTQSIKKSEISSKAKQKELYGICELAQLSINDKCKSHQWALETYPSPLSLPKSIFTPSQSANVRFLSLPSFLRRLPFFTSNSTLLTSCL